MMNIKNTNISNQRNFIGIRPFVQFIIFLIFFIPLRLLTLLVKIFIGSNNPKFLSNWYHSTFIWLKIWIQKMNEITPIEWEFSLVHFQEDVNLEFDCIKFNWFMCEYNLIVFDRLW